ncbi:hypothetical protein [Halomonas sp. ATBC28]|uniref:hypothetical protein n=1 Tax=Halomonas sp. ATBC28 TaxID=2545264 RepID=UPI001BB1EB88|nr:hypothetical protein [Halomonas sp. ATBC28]
MMNIQPIHNDADLDRAFAHLEELWAADAGTPEADELEALSLFIKKYEDDHYPVGSSHSA